MHPSLVAGTPLPGVQQSLFASVDAGPTCAFDHARRVDLGDGAWVESIPGCVPSGDRLFEVVLATAPWGDEPPRVMYDNKVDVPRRTTGQWGAGRPPELDEIATRLGERYDVDLVSISANLYRDGSDSVAWHGDQVGRFRTATIVAVLSLGSPRRLLIRPDGGGPSTGFTMHSGDLVVMGGTAQRTHEHCVPKRGSAGPRISIMFRERDGH